MNLSANILNQRPVISGPASAANKLICRAGRPARAHLYGGCYQTVAVAAAPGWSIFTYAYSPFNPTDFGGKATFGTAAGGVVHDPVGPNAQMGFRLVNVTGGSAVLAGADAGIDDTCHVTAWTTGTPANFTDGAYQIMRLEAQELNCGGTNCTVYHYNAAFEDA